MTDVNVNAGDYFVSRSNSGAWFKRLLPAVIRWVTGSRWNHAGVYIGSGFRPHTNDHGYWVIEAQPGGVRYWPVSDYLTDNTLWSDGYKPDGGKLSREERDAIVTAAVGMVGTPYGLLDCIALALAQKKLGSRVDVRKALEEQPWWVRRLQRRDTVICSQLVDRVYQQAGIHLFNDGRLEDWVTPGDLGDLLEGDYEPLPKR